MKVFHFKHFLTYTETTFNDGKKRIEEDATKSMLQITTLLESIFPELQTQQLSNETTSTDDVPRLKEFLLKVEAQMRTLLTLGEKLFNRLSEICSDVTTFNLNFENVFAAEENCPYKSNVERQDIRKPLNEWSQFQYKQVELFYEFIYHQLNYEYQDIVAFLELFKYRETIEYKWHKAKAKVDKWNNEQKTGVELKEKDEQNKKRDIEEEKELSTHLAIMTKIILYNEIGIMWKEKSETWKQQITKFAQLYTEILQQSATSWKSITA